MTLTTILAHLYERLNYQSAPAAAVTTRLTNSVNLAYRRILREPGLAMLRDTAAGLYFTASASRSIYGLPWSVAAIRAITDRTNDRRLLPASLSDLRAMDPGLDATGTPSCYVPLGMKALGRPLDDDTGESVTIESGAPDTRTFVGTLLRLSGIAVPFSGTLNGTTPVAITALTDIVDILTLSLSATSSTLVCTIKGSATGAVGVVYYNQTSPSSFNVQLWPTPTAATTYYVDATQRIVDLTATESPLLPDEFHDLLVDGALIVEYEKQDDPRLAAVRDTYQRGLSRLKFWAAAQPDSLPVMGHGPAPRTSRLGSWVPADRF